MPTSRAGRSVLFVGGPLDGELRVVSTADRVIVVAERLPTADEWREPAPPGAVVPIREHRYRLEHLFIGDVATPVMVVEGFIGEPAQAAAFRLILQRAGLEVRDAADPRAFIEGRG